MSEAIPGLSFEDTQTAFAYKSDSELRKAVWLFSLINSNLITQVGTRITPVAFKLGLPIKSLVRSTIFSQFCGGETLAECAIAIGRLSQYHVETILDYGIEAKETEEEFEKTVREIIAAISFASINHHVPFVSIKITGIAPFSLLEKLHASKKLTIKELVEWDAVKDRNRPKRNGKDDDFWISSHVPDYYYFRLTY